MAINGLAHSTQNVFSTQAYSVFNSQKSRGLRQDKGASERARTASRQPAPRDKLMRSHHVNNNTSRSQKKPSTKRKTVHLTLWVKPIVKAELQRIAEREGLSVSRAGGAFLEKALQKHIDMQYSALLQPIIKEAIVKQMRSISTRLAFLPVRVAFATKQTRSLAANILGRQPGMSPDVLNEILDRSSQAAKGKITQSTPQLEDLIVQVEQWLSTKDNEKKDL